MGGTASLLLKYPVDKIQTAETYSKKYTFRRYFLSFYMWLGICYCLIATIILLLTLYPEILYKLNRIPTAKQELELLSDNTIFNSEEALKQEEVEKQEPEDNLPPLDPTLGTTNRVIIPSVGIDSPISQGEDYEEGLKKGAWLVSGYGKPGEEGPPIILAGHRYGYEFYTNRERTKKIMFYLLPDTQVGDRVEIIWEQRKYVYEIYKLEENTNVTDYNADLILYTCKDMTGTQRVFRYANLVTGNDG